KGVAALGRGLSQPSRWRSKVTKEEKMTKLALLVPLVLVLAATACSSGGESSGVAGSTGGGGAEPGAAEAAPGAGGSQASDAPVSSSAVPQVGPQIVKTA